MDKGEKDMSLMDLLPKSNAERKRNAREKTAVAAAIGVGVGAVAGILLAPKAGKETRAELAANFQELPGKVRELSDKTKELAGEAKGKITAKIKKDLCGSQEAEPIEKKVLQPND